MCELSLSMTYLHPHRAESDQIFQKYLDRAIEDINELGDTITSCGACTHDTRSAPVVGTGHPLADIFLLKMRPQADEVREGVAFFGRAGDAIRRSIARLGVDPLDLYGTNVVKCTERAWPCVSEHHPEWLRQELAIVKPTLMIIMGEETLNAVNALDLEDAVELDANLGNIQMWTTSCSVLLCPDIDTSLVNADDKRTFWDAFRGIAQWHDQRVPF